MKLQLDTITVDVMESILKFTMVTGVIFSAVICSTAVIGTIPWPIAILFADICFCIILIVSFALLLPQTRKYKAIQKQMTSEGYIVEESCSANWIMGKENVGGYLFLCSKEMVFAAHNHNAHTGFIVLPYDEIKTMSWVKNRLCFCLFDGKKKYVSTQRKKEIKQYLDCKINHIG